MGIEIQKIKVFEDIFTWIFVPVIIVLIIAGFVKMINYFGELERTKERNRKKAIEDNKRKEFERKAVNIYAENLSRLYDHRSTDELIKISSILRTMYVNRPEFDDPDFKEKAEEYSRAENELKQIMNNSVWKYLCLGNKIEYEDYPIKIKQDIDYVEHLLKSRGLIRRY